VTSYIKNQKKKTGRNIYTIVLCAYISVLVIAAIFGDLGILKNWELFKENRVLEGNVAVLEDENKNIRREIDNLAGNPRFIEKVAREELNMSRDDEITFIFKEDEEPKPAPQAKGR
jgi:cell division protein FtsB